MSVMHGSTRRQVIAGGAGLALSGSAVAGRMGSGSALDGPWTGRGDVAVGGGRLHFATLGQGAPLVLLPKLGGWIADWRFAASDLAKRRKVIAIDPPGHGGSRMHGPPPYIMTVPECAAMVLAVLDELGVDRFSIAGNSLGGVIGAVLAACWPERIDRLALISTSLIGTMSREAIEEQDRHPKGAVSKLSIAERSRSFGTLDPRVTQEHDRSSALAGKWLRACERGVGRAGVTDYLPRIAAPTLLLNADRGRYVKYVEVGMRLIPHARSASIPDAGSFLHQEKPAETAAIINDFLDGQ